jgi:hypothetical protein
MGKPATLLEKICEHILYLGADSFEVEYKDNREWVYARKDNAGISIANFESSSEDAGELRRNLYAAAKKPVRTLIAGRPSILRVRITDSFGEDAFHGKIEPAPKADPGRAPSFTAKQGQYLAYIHYYTKIHRQPPAESDMQRYFQVSPPSVHDMIKTLHRNGLIERTPGEARSIHLLVPAEHLPPLE